MTSRFWVAPILASLVLVPVFLAPDTPGCCPVAKSGTPVVNADQTVIILWDAADGVEHFIRKASFKTAAEDLGFLVPTPSQPELEESGNEAFPYLQKLTEPDVRRVSHSIGISCGCSKPETKRAVKSEVRVLVEKEVAGFNAAVLEANSGDALVNWLRDNGYDYSPQIEAWAKPYVASGWKFTALKVAKGHDGKDGDKVSAGSLRIIFKTDKPLFPYREPDPQSPAEALGARRRLLRIYFLGNTRYGGTLTGQVPWEGRTAWSDKLTDEQRLEALRLLKLPQNTAPVNWWLTEFEDN